MNEADALELFRSALWTVVLVSGPPVAAAMVIGIIVALFQALTQIQEMTLTFVPKMIAIFLVTAAFGPFIGGKVMIFSEEVYSRIEGGFGGGRGSGGPGAGSAETGSVLRPGFAPLRYPVSR